MTFFLLPNISLFKQAMCSMQPTDQLADATFCAQLKAAPSFLFVGDSALYEKCVAEDKNSPTENPMLWLSRVPSTIKEAKALLALPDQAVNWTQLDAGYKIRSCVSKYGNVPQRWLLVFSEQAYTREGATLDRTVKKEYEAMEQKIDSLSRTVFNCVEDANKALALFSKSLKYHTVKANVQENTGYQNSGRPRKRAQPVVLGYKIQGKLIPHADKIAAIRLQKGRFILATNQLDEQALPAENMLKEYKNQHKTEASFRFIKGNAFEVSSVFLKKVSRIQSLMMVMTLCLMIYGLSEYLVRNALTQHQATIPNQLKKPTQKPTMAYVCRLFHGIHVLHVQWEGYIQQCVINLKAVTKQLIGYFGLKAKEIYGLQPS